MQRYSFETLGPSRSGADPLAVLDTAMGATNGAAGRRVRASGNSRSPDEGLALLDAYIAIDDRDLRQAILDVVLAIAAGARTF